VTITARAKPRERARLRSAKRRSDMSMGLHRLEWNPLRPVAASLIVE
jgi:hypothetical protein